MDDPSQPREWSRADPAPHAGLKVWLTRVSWLKPKALFWRTLSGAGALSRWGPGAISSPPGRTLTKQSSINLLCVAIALGAFLGTGLLLHPRLPPPVVEGVSSKLKFFSEHKDEFNTLFRGTSRFYYGVSPEIFDSVTRENGLSTRTFNFGVDGMHPPENFYVLEQILKTKPRNLKWVFIECEDVQTSWTAEVRGTRRVLYWHDWKRTLMIMKKTINPRGGAKWYGQIARLWLERRDLVTNLTLCAKRATNVGRVADFFSPLDGQSALQAELELGPKRDGYRLAGSAMSAERAVRFQQKLVGQVSAWRMRFIDPYAEKGCRDGAVQIRQVGAEPIFVVTPVIWQSRYRFRNSPPPGPLLAFNDSKAYPSLFDTKVRIDEGHLTKEGAEAFTRLLALEFVRRARQP